MTDLQKQIKELDAKLDIIQLQNEEILCLLRPVSSHASFVGDLKKFIYNSRILKSFGFITENNNTLITE